MKDYSFFFFLRRTGGKMTNILVLCLLVSVTAFSQAYIKKTQAYAVNTSNVNRELVADNAGNTYLLATIPANTFPVTIASAPASGGGSVLVKHDPDGNILWSRYLLPGATFLKMALDNNILHFLGTATVTNLPVTNGTVAGGNTDVVYARVDAASGAVLTSGYLGGSGYDGNGIDMAVENGNAYVTFATTSDNITKTTGPDYTSGYDHIMMKLNAQGTPVYSTYIGSVGTTADHSDTVSLKVSNGNATLALVVSSTNNFITTNGSTVKGNTDFGLVKLDATGNKTMAIVYGSPGDELKPVLAVNNNELYLTGYTTNNNYPVTDGSSFAGTFDHYRNVVTKFSSSGAVLFSTMKVGLFNAAEWPVMQVNNGALYILNQAAGSSTLNTTDGTTGFSYLLKMNAVNGQTLFATRFMGTRLVTNEVGIDMLIEGDKVYTALPIYVTTNPVTDGSPPLRQAGTYIAVYTTQGKLFYATMWLSGVFNSTGNFARLALAGSTLYVTATGTGSTAANNMPVTDPNIQYITGASLRPLTWSAIEFCPPMPTENNISPLTQNICAGGFTQNLNGNKVAYESSNMPPLYRGGVTYQQNEIQARYQWQSSVSPSGPWTDIPGLGTQKDYSPPSAAESRYYRRLVLPPDGCGNDPVSISDVAAVLVSANTAPVVTGAVFNTCVGAPVDVSVSVSGGTAPYTYAWDNGVASTTNEATVTPAANSVYTVKVTDNLGCEQAGQVIVNAYAADAGPATVGVCDGQPVRLGVTPPAGLAGVSYSWSAVDGLDDATIAQPMASPSTATTYTLEMTIPVSGGGTCATTDDVTVNLVEAPATANFAGPDQAVCKGGTLSLGTAAETGFTYTWSPGSYLSTQTASITTFDAGSEMPATNPITYRLTAAKEGCTFTDAVIVGVLDVDAGTDMCGPRTVGTADKMPGVTGKTWLWEVVSGTGTITGPTNTPTTTVSASTGGSTVYRVTVSYLGASCSDDVVVSECGDVACPVAEIEVLADHGCANTAFGDVTLRAKPYGLPETQWTYSWSSLPSGGLSATTGSSITLTDNIERDVTVTVTSIDNPSFSCSRTIHVNNPAWSIPVFTATDATVCPNSSIAIGNAPVTGYSYTWVNVDEADAHDANPTVTPAITTSYIVQVKDDNNGCIKTDTALITVNPVVIDPGSNWITCSNAVIQMGSPEITGYTYSWVPAAAAYQDGTSSTSAQPKVLVAISQDFTLTVTDTETGCSRDSTIHIEVDDSPTLTGLTDTAICAGGSATIGLPEQAGVTYSWSPATGLSSTTVAQPVATPTTTQVYTLVVSYYDALGNITCTKSGTSTVTVHAPEISGMSDATICPSDALYNLGDGVSVTGDATITYAWTPAVLVTTPTALNTTVKANPTTPTTFTLTARDGNGCQVSATKTITPTVTAPEAGSAGQVCVGSSVQLGAASNTGAISWSVTPAIAGTIDNPNAPQPVFTPAAADSGKVFTFTISQTDGGCTSTDQVAITVRKAYIPAMAPQTICNNASTTIGVPAIGGYTYLWTPATNLQNANASTTIVNQVTGNTYYTLTARDVNGCFASAEAVIGVNPSSAPTVTIPDVVVPVGMEASAFQPEITPASGTYSYSWSPAAGVDNPYISNATPIPGEIGSTSYTLSLTDANGCTSQAEAQMIVTAIVEPLPITITSFKALPGKCSVLLQWETAAAENFSHFVIERSSDGIGFESIGTVNFEYLRNRYQFADAGAGNNRWTYRLKLVDVDGQSKYSTLVIVKSSCGIDNQLVAYPNPITNFVHVKSSKPVKQVRLLTITGSVVWYQQYNQTQPAIIRIPVDSRLKPGIYLLGVWDADGIVKYTKLLKQ